MKKKNLGCEQKVTGFERMYSRLEKNFGLIRLELNSQSQNS